MTVTVLLGGQMAVGAHDVVGEPPGLTDRCAGARAAEGAGCGEVGTAALSPAAHASVVPVTASVGEVMTPPASLSGRSLRPSTGLARTPAVQMTVSASNV